MNPKAKLDALIEFICRYPLKHFNDRIIYDLPSDIDKSKLEHLLEEAGYKLDSIKTIRNNKLEIKLSSTSWVAGNSSFFVSWDQLFERVLQSSLLPSHYHVSSETLVDDNIGKVNHQRIKLFCKVRSLLAQLADHCEPSKGNAIGRDKLLFLIETENTVNKYDFPPTLKWQAISTIQNPKDDIDKIDSLIKSINVGDSQDSERKLVMRSAFNELAKTCIDQTSIFTTLMGSLFLLKMKYDEHHELFIKRFSVNKILQEISKQDLEYTSKINEIISSGQTKALTIPGALIAIGAIMKIDSPIDGFAVLLGMFFTALIVAKSIKVHEDTFAHIEEQIPQEFDRYNDLNEKAEIRRQAVKVKKNLLDLVDKASKSLTFIYRILWCTFGASCIYILLTLSSINKEVTDVSQKINEEPVISIIEEVSEVKPAVTEKVNNIGQEQNKDVKSKAKKTTKV